MPAGQNQQITIAFLSLPQSYPERPASVERIDTHGAVIFLAGERAYKLKRAVRLPYLDFSTCKNRRAICEREVALNRLTAPELYLGVVPVVRDAHSGALSLGGEGEPVDWLVEMRRFDQEALFDRLALAGRLDLALIEPLAEAIAAFHQGAPVNREATWLQSLDEIAETLENALTSEAAKAVGLDAADYFPTLRAFLARGTKLLAERQGAGYVRRCHGDLHLRNIVLQAGRPVLFDALEFDERLATIDVLYDLAFLLMDLWHRGLKAHANRLLNAYLQYEAGARPLAGLGALPLFLSLRAAIRAMVGVHGLAHQETGRQDKASAEIISYLTLARSFLSPPQPRLIAIGGVSGTGKTTIARKLAPLLGAAPGAIHLRTDVERKQQEGAWTRRLGPAHYSVEARRAVYLRVMEKADAVLRAGHAAIIDATFLDARDGAAAAQTAHSAGAAFTGLWLEAEPAELMVRVAARHGDASDADADVVRQQLAGASAPTDWQRLDASGGIDSVFRLAQRALKLEETPPSTLNK